MRQADSLRTTKEEKGLNRKSNWVVVPLVKRCLESMTHDAPQMLIRSMASVIVPALSRLIMVYHPY